MSRSDRVQVTVSAPMLIALEHLARRNGLPPSTQAMVLLRQALDRTIGSAEVQEAMRRRVASRSVASWQQDTTTERAVEVAYAEEVRRGRLAPTAPEAPSTGQSAPDGLRVAQEKQGGLK